MSSGRVDVGFVGTQEQRAIGFLESLFTERQPSIEGNLAQVHIVLFGAGKMLQE